MVLLTGWLTLGFGQAAAVVDSVDSVAAVAVTGAPTATAAATANATTPATRSSRFFSGGNISITPWSCSVGAEGNVRPGCESAFSIASFRFWTRRVNVVHRSGAHVARMVAAGA